MGEMSTMLSECGCAGGSGVKAPTRCVCCRDLYDDKCVQRIWKGRKSAAGLDGRIPTVCLYSCRDSHTDET